MKPNEKILVITEIEPEDDLDFYAPVDEEWAWFDYFWSTAPGSEY